MFQYFFEEYEETIFKSTQSEQKNWDIDWNVCILLMGCLVVLLMLQGFLKAVIILILGIAGSCAAIRRMKSIQRNRQRQRTFFEESLFYRYEKIVPLEKMMQRDYYNLYHKEGVKWLMHQCNRKLYSITGNHKTAAKNLKADLRYIQVNLRN